jgi:hypothetical protein
MNESEFEQQLRGLRPSRPSRELESRIARELTPVAVTPVVRAEGVSWLERLLPGLGWAAVGAAAAVTIMLSLNLVAAPSPISSHVEPMERRVVPPPRDPESGSDFSGDIIEASDEGIMDGENGGIGRRVRYSSVERHAWTEISGAITVVEVPREDVVLFPVAFQ